MELLYSSGIRVGELVGLNLNQLDLDLGIVKVMGKGRKERIVPVGSKAVEALKAYLEKRGSLRWRRTPFCQLKRGETYGSKCGKVD